MKEEIKTEKLMKKEMEVEKTKEDECILK
jgi:hypothetical protein